MKHLQSVLAVVVVPVVFFGLGLASQPFPVMAEDGHNAQKLYALRSAEYEALRTLYIEQGIALPFSSGPFSEAEIRLAMDRLNTGRMSSAGHRTFNWLRDRISGQSVAGGLLYEEEGGRFAFDAGAEFTVESYIHTDRDNRYWEYKWEDRRPFARFPIEGWVGRFGYAAYDLAFIKNVPDFAVYPTYRRSGQFGFDAEGDFELSTTEEDPWTNWPVVPKALDIQFPHRAFISVGGERWNASIGRGQIDWGNGRTGNLYISDYADWYDSLQFSTFWDRFKFSWMWVSLDGTLVDGEREYRRREVVGWDIDDNDPPVYTYDSGAEHKNLLAQRFEVRLWDRLGLAYTMGIIFGRERVELRHLNPVYDYHNLYTNSQWVGNAHRSYEFDFAVAPGVSLYGVFAPDQWTSPLEPETSLGKEPNAFSALAGVDTRFPMGGGFLQTTVEGVYTSPWMGVHNHTLTSITTRRFVMAHHSKGPTQLFYDKPIGHYGGNDYTLLWLDSSYGVPGRYRYGITGSWEGDGSVPLNELLESKIDPNLRDPLSESDATMVAPSSGYVDRNGVRRVAMWTNAVTLYGEFYPRGIGKFNEEGSGVVGPVGPGASPGRTLSIGSELSAQWTKNRFNLPSPWNFDLQWVLTGTVAF
jgi:hypothetical protein